MRKIENKGDDALEIPIMVTVNLCMEHQKQMKFFTPRRIKLTILILGATIVFYLFGSPILAFINLASLASLLSSTNSLKMTTRSALKSMCKNMAWAANGYDRKVEYNDDVRVEIVPKNMHMGDDLEAINMVPIFKEGKYVIIKSYDYPVFMRVFGDKGEEEIYVMEPIDEDIEALESDLPEYQEYIDVLKLQKKPPVILDHQFY